MYALDFEYDKHYLSDFGFIICDFDGSSGAVSATPGSKITFNTVSVHRGKRNNLVGTKYEECIQAKFHVCKNPELFDDLKIANDEYRDLMRWLNRNEYLRFQALYDHQDDESRDACYFDASFNVGKVTVGEILYGLELEMFTNRPFGYGEEQVFSKNISDTTKVYLLNDMSDEVGITYPSVTITCFQNGNLIIRNITEDSTVQINNCLSGEVIHLNGEALTITTSITTHDIANDFNYEFLKIGNTIGNRANKISISLPCKIEIRYTPIIKDIP